MNTFKMTALGALATVGLATTAVAQSKVDHRPDRAQNTQEQQRAHWYKLAQARLDALAQL